MWWWTRIEQQIADLQSSIGAIDSILVAINGQLDKILTGVNKMAVSLAALQTAVANETTIDASVETLVSGMAAQIQQLINASGNTVDPVALQALVDTMTANASGMGALVTQNTAAATPATAVKPAS
jgi:hypothetical protein